MSDDQKFSEETMKFFDEMTALREEPLHEDLQPWVFDSEFGKVLKHPLIYDVPLFLPGMDNRTYLAKKAELERCEQERDWKGCVYLHEKAHRTTALIEYVLGTDEFGEPIPLVCYKDDPDNPDAIDLAIFVWTDSENLDQHTKEWDAIFKDASHLLMSTEEDREEFAKLPDTFVVYRGDIEDGGYSWTTDLKVAEFFAHRWNANDPIITGTVNKSDVFGYMTNRSESEVLVRRENVHNIRRING